MTGMSDKGVGVHALARHIRGQEHLEPRRTAPLAPRQTPEEAAAHREFVEALGPASVWRSLGY